MNIQGERKRQIYRQKDRETVYHHQNKDKVKVIFHSESRGKDRDSFLDRKTETEIDR